MTTKKIILATSGLIFTVISLIILASGYFYLSSQFSPARLEKIVRNELKTMFPLAEIEVEQITIRYGLNILFNIDKMRIHLKNEQIDLFSAEDIKGEVSIFSILTTRANANISMKNPIITYRDFEKESNWSLARGDNPQKNDSFLIPVALARSSINLKLTNVSINYSLKSKAFGNILLSNCSIKNISFEEESAFKIESKTALELARGKKISFDSLIIGQFSLTDLVKKNHLSTLVVIRPTNIFWMDRALSVNEPVINLKINMNELGEIIGDVETTIAEKNRLNFKYNITKKQSTLSDINMEIYLSELEEIFNKKLSMIDTKLSKINLSGKLELEDKYFNPTLSFNVTPPLSWKYKTAYGDADISGNYSSKKFDLKVQSKSLGGIVDTTIEGLLEQIPTSGKIVLAPLKIDILFSHLDFEKSSIQKFFYIANNKRPPFPVKFSNKSLLPPSEISIKSQNVKINGENIQFEGKVIVSSKGMAIPSLNFKMVDGFGKLKSTLLLNNRTELEHKTDLSLNAIPLRLFDAFLPPSFDIFDGEISGNAKSIILSKIQKKQKINIDYKLTITNGKFKGIDIKSKFNKLFTTSPIFRNKDDRQLIIDEKFKNLTIDGLMQKDLLIFKKIKIDGQSGAYEFVGDGKIDIRPHSQSIVDFKLKDNSGILGDMVLPIRFSGTGTDLFVDKTYIEKEIQNIMQKKYKNLYKKNKPGN